MIDLARHLPVPPGLETAWGYHGRARFVSFWWLAGVMHDDGEVTACGTATHAWAVYWSSPLVRSLCPNGAAFLGPSRRLLLDRRLRMMRTIAHQTAYEPAAVTPWMPPAQPLEDHFPGFLGVSTSFALRPALIDTERVATIAMSLWLDESTPNHER